MQNTFQVVAKMQKRPGMKSHHGSVVTEHIKNVEFLGYSSLYSTFKKIYQDRVRKGRRGEGKRRGNRRETIGFFI